MSQTILETSRNLLDVFLLDEFGIHVNCICPEWVKTPAAQHQIADAVIMFIRDDALAGRMVIWPDGEPWRPVPVTGTAG